MLKSIQTLLCAIAMLAAAAIPAQATILVQYDTAASGTNPALTPSTADISLSSVDDLTAGTGIDSASGGTWNWNNWADGGTANTSFADAVAEGETWNWGFSVATGTTLSDLTMDLRLDRSGTGPNQVEIQAAVNAGTPTSVLTYDFGDGSAGVDFVGVDLSGLGILIGGDTVTFTLAAWGADSGGAGSTGTFDLETVDFGGSDPRSLRIEGTVVPEPAGLLALAVAGIGAGVVRRRRR